MVITLSFVGLDGLTSSSLEDKASTPAQAPAEEEKNCGHGHHPFLLSTRRADLLISRRWQRPWQPSQLFTDEWRKVTMIITLFAL